MDNVRIKSLYTKASVDDVVDATFESIVIKPENIKNGEVITSYAGLERKVVKSVAINVDTYVNVIKDYIMAVRNYRRVVKYLIGSFDTLRRVSYNNELIFDIDTLRDIIKIINISNDLNRKVIAKEIKQLDTNRVVNALVKVDIAIDTKRVVYKSGTLYIPQLNANFKLSKGKLILTKQDF
ncbi:hypothetical protein LPC13_02775 [Clostridium celatum]|uniref:hypothetical protein n=1 Tax=Clostridium celatum TaxID=36834 RepID=UPI001F2EC783|nr:hypothetical protein [Clostridium celatum]MCE9654197.1 hypothetical protein [Clostridium celatum]